MKPAIRAVKRRFKIRGYGEDTGWNWCLSMTSGEWHVCASWKDAMERLTRYLTMPRMRVE